MLNRILMTLLTIVVALGLAGCPCLSGQAVYFLMGDEEHPEAGYYILPLTNPLDIAHARQLIAGQTEERGIALAFIHPGDSSGDYVNRNLDNDGEPWSWRVIAFDDWVDSTAEIYDGTARYVDENLDTWMDETDGVIAFWSYRPIREVTVEEMNAPLE